MAAPLTDTTELLALPTLERQFIYISEKLMTAQQERNQLKPNAPVNVLTVVPDYTANNVAITAQLNIEPDSVGQILHDSIEEEITA